MNIADIKHRWSPTPRADFREKEYVRCDGLRVRFGTLLVGTLTDNWTLIGWPVGVLWDVNVGRKVFTEATKRNKQPFSNNGWREDTADKDIYAPGAPWSWLVFLDANVPLQSIDQVVVREFFKQTVDDLQTLRREGWTFLQIGAPRCVRIEMVWEPDETTPKHVDTMFPPSGRRPGETWARDVLAERVEKGVPT